MRLQISKIPAHATSGNCKAFTIRRPAKHHAQIVNNYCSPAGHPHFTPSTKTTEYSPTRSFWKNLSHLSCLALVLIVQSFVSAAQLKLCGFVPFSLRTSLENTPDCSSRFTAHAVKLLSFEQPNILQSATQLKLSSLSSETSKSSKTMSSLKLFNHSIGQSSLIKDIRATNSVMVTLDNTASPAVTLEIKHHDVIVLETVKSCIQNPRKFTKVPWSSVQDVYPDFDEMLSIYLAVFDCDLVESTTTDGILLLGASGTGKTTAAAAWAAHIGAAFFGISATIMSSCVNQIEEYVSNVSCHQSNNANFWLRTLILALETVRRIAQTGRHVVVLFDEFDRLVPKGQFAGANAALSRSIALILKHQLAMNVVSGLPIFVFATTCHPDRLDLSDIDRYFLMKSHFRLPDLQQRVRLWNNRWSIEKDVVNVSQKEIQNLADQTSGFAASDIHALFGRAIGLRVHEYQLSTTWVQVSFEHFLPLFLLNESGRRGSSSARSC